MSNPAAPLCQVAVAAPLHQLFDYLWPFPLPPVAGQLVQVPFGRRQLFGIVMSSDAGSVDRHKLKAVTQQFPQCALDADLLALARWCASYYHHPTGEVAATMMPPAMRKPTAPETWWQLTDAGAGALDSVRGARQRQVLSLLASGRLPAAQLRQAGISAAVLTRMEAQCWIGRSDGPGDTPTPLQRSTAPQLLPGQRAALDAVAGRMGHFAPFLLHGITGSGKTEVYLGLIEQLLERGEQALVIVPEIGLTPQLLQRFEQRLGQAVGVLHSQMAAGQRATTWQRARQGHIRVVVGTRSAVFCPLPKLALIVVDEEHDLSFKQQEGFRYSARDVAVARARMAGVPVVLGSATPSLETLANCDRDRYQYLRLAIRPGAAQLPDLHLVDLRGEQELHGLASASLKTVSRHLARGEQVLVFLNRRGFAPVLLCNACGWSADCPRCDARMTLHRGRGGLRCHHCGTARALPVACPQCASTRLIPLGIGTQRLEQFLVEKFPDYPVWRWDRDAIRSTRHRNDLLDAVHSGVPGLLVGTQMLAKGHDFPRVTLVVVANIDQALYSSDFRSTERTAQLLVQVAGRAGRAASGGQVLIQTHHPDHPLFSRVLANGYLSYARELLAERRAAGYPPFGYMALVRAEAHEGQAADHFLTEALALAPANPAVEVLGPLPSPMARRAGRFRMQLLLNATSRGPLHQLLESWLPTLSTLKSSRRVRWSVDVDPQDMF